MDKLPPLDQLSSEQKDNIIIALQAYVIKLEARILELEEEVKNLKSKLGRNSQTAISHLLRIILRKISQHMRRLIKRAVDN